MERTLANSIMDSILASVTPEMTQALAVRLGESPRPVYEGLGTAAAAILDGLASKVDAGHSTSETLGFIRAAAAEPAGAAADAVDRFLKMVFGSQLSQVARAIAQQYGLSASSGTGLLRMAAAVLWAILAKAQSAGTLDAETLEDMVRNEAPNLRGYLPSDLIGTAAGVAHRTPNRERLLPQAGDGAEGVVPRWLVPAAIAGALVLAWLAIRALTAPKVTAPAIATVTAEATNTGVTAASKAALDAATAAWTALGDMMKVKLPDGSELNVPSLGVEARLVKFLSDSSAAVSDAAWFDFDRLLFDTGKATLQSASREQLTNIASILKAFPQVRIRIGGYTDNTGEPVANLRLSEERANNVMDELVKLGIDPARMSARGYGGQNPVADNSTEEGRQRNRRITLRVTDKQASVSAAARPAAVRRPQETQEVASRGPAQPDHPQSAPPP